MAQSNQPLVGCGDDEMSMAPVIRAGGQVYSGELLQSEKAFEHWLSWRSGFRRSQLWPLLFVDAAEGRDSVSENTESYKTLEVYSRAVLDFPIERWLKDSTENPNLAESTGGNPDRFSGYKASGFALLRPGSTSALALLPAAEPWQAAWYLPQGLGNNAHGELTHVLHGAMLRRWRQNWGAEIVCTDGYSELELRVDRRPQSRREALALAWEHVCYCDDALDRLAELPGVSGSGSLAIEELASSSRGVLHGGSGGTEWAAV